MMESRKKLVPVMNASADKRLRRKKSIEDGGRTPAMHRRKSLRLQHSISLHIPMSQLDNVSNCVMNCYIDLPPQLFNLTYIDENATQNPESLDCLKELKEKYWQVFLAGHLYNFNYLQTHMKALSKVLTSALTVGFQNSDMIFYSEINIADQFSPTDNDQKALMITVHGVKQDKQTETLIYHGYLMSWCNPVKAANVMLPILLCRGLKRYRSLIHSVLSERFDLNIRPFLLTQEEFTHLSTYCLVMLDQNDPYSANFTYRILSGTINLSVPLEHILKLWNKIHPEGNNEVELDEINVFHEALDAFYETTFGTKLGYAHCSCASVPKCFKIHVNGQIWLKSTKVLHVVLKYLVHLAVQRLKVKVLNRVVGGQLALSNITV